MSRSSCRTCSTVRRRDAPRYDVILVGDLFYERDTAARALAFLDRHAAVGTRVLIGDPGRTYLPKERLTLLAEYSVPVTRELEDMEIKRTSVWELMYARRHTSGGAAMTFAGINYLAVIIAAVARLARRRASTTACSRKPWVAAHGKTMEEFKARAGRAQGHAARAGCRSRSRSSPNW